MPAVSTGWWRTRSLRLYPRQRAAGAGKLLGHLVVTKVRTVDSDVAPWDEARAADFQKNRYITPKDEALQGGEPCEIVFLAYGDLKLRVAAATTDEQGKPIDPKVVQAVREILGKLTERARQFITIAEPGSAQWLVRPAGQDLQLLRREGMSTGPLTIPLNDPARLSDRLTAIARAQCYFRWRQAIPRRTRRASGPATRSPSTSSFCARPAE